MVELRACLRCAGTDLRMATIGDGLWPGGDETRRWVCRSCGEQGQGIVFEDEEAWRAFARARRPTQRRL